MEFEQALKPYHDLKVRLILFMNGIGRLNVDDIHDPEQCPFGQWLKVAQNQSPDCHIIQELSETHKAFYMCSAEIIDLVKRGQNQVARTYVKPEGLLLQLVHRLSKAILVCKQSRRFVGI